MNIDLPAPASALVVIAHPDDAEFQCGATLAKWANSGTEVNYLICTDGSKGTWNPNCDQNQLIQDREREQRNAARSLGATGQIVFLGHTDGELSSDIETRSEVAFVIRKVQPRNNFSSRPLEALPTASLTIATQVSWQSKELSVLETHFFFKNTALRHTARMPFSCSKLTSQIMQKTCRDGIELK